MTIRWNRPDETIPTDGHTIGNCCVIRKLASEEKQNRTSTVQSSLQFLNLTLWCVIHKNRLKEMILMNGFTICLMLNKENYCMIYYIEVCFTVALLFCVMWLPLPSQILS